MHNPKCQIRTPKGQTRREVNKRLSRAKKIIESTVRKGLLVFHGKKFLCSTKNISCVPQKGFFVS